MGETTGISWTDHTFNPWEGCTKVSPGCKNCYAEARNARFHPELVGLPEDMPKRTGNGLHWGDHADRLMRSPAYWREPLKWAKAARAAGERRRVFCASLGDVFEDRPDVLDARARLFALIEQTPELDWLLLTKRPEKMLRLAPASWAGGWPSHVWAGTTAESNDTLWDRARHLLRVPARVRFLSCEPLLEEVDLRPYLGGSFRCAGCDTMQWPVMDEPSGRCGEDEDFEPACRFVEVGVHWVIVGGESGPKARRFDLAWARSVVAQCAEAGVPCFVKQLGARPVGDWGDGRLPQWDDRPGRRNWVTRHPAGADPSEWPEDLRVQEWPAEAS